MTTDWFSKLKEYDSLLKLSLHSQNTIQEEEKRITKLKTQFDEREELIKALNEENVSLSIKYLEDEKKLNMNESQAKNLQDIGGDETKIKNFLTEAARIENELMDIIEKQEVIQSDLKDHQTFLNGLNKTINEIQSEVRLVVEKCQSEISQYKMRLDLLTEELPDNFRSAIQRVLAKKLAHGPFTKNENGSCYFCRYKISKLDESEIDVLRILKHCPQCSRIFLPYA